MEKAISLYSIKCGKRYERHIEKNVQIYARKLKFAVRYDNLKKGKNEVSERAFFILLKERKNEGKPLIRDVSENKKEWFINDPKRNER